MLQHSMTAICWKAPLHQVRCKVQQYSMKFIQKPGMSAVLDIDHIVSFVCSLYMQYVACIITGLHSIDCI